MKVIFLGPPGAGKGTQAGILGRRLGVPVISTGNILREAMASGTPIGRQVEPYMELGSLVPDNLIIRIIRERLRGIDCAGGYILDGAPRTVGQARALEAAGIEFDAALLLVISDGIIEERMTGRRTCAQCSATFHIRSNPPAQEDVCDRCGGHLDVRKDDEPETLRNRLRIYHRQTEPLIEFYSARGKLVKVENQPTIEATAEAVARALGV